MPRFRRYVFLVAGAYLYLLSIAAQAVTTSWNTNASGTFTTPANWTSGVPDSDDTAVFNRGAGVGYTVTFPGGSVLNPPPNYVINYLRVQTNEVTFADNSSPTVTSPSLSVANPDVSIVVGQDAGEVAVLNTSLGSLSGANASIGRAAAAEGTLNVSEGTFNISGSLVIGDSGTGTMNVTAGAQVQSASGSIGVNALSTGLVNVDGVNSTWLMTTGGLAVGADGQGTLNITNGGLVQSGRSTIGSSTGLTTAVTVDGANSTWAIFDDLVMGGGGTSTLTLTNDGGLFCLGLLDAFPGAEIRGNGTITGNVTSRGLVAPGTSTGKLQVNGDFTQGMLGTFEVELAGLSPGTQYDQLQVTGTVRLNPGIFGGGNLNVSLLDGFVPGSLDTFTILAASTNLTGAFGNVADGGRLDTQGGEGSFLVRYNSTIDAVVLSEFLPALFGDYNDNGTVDAADYALWRDNNNTATTLPNDATPGTSPADYVVWRTHFGQQKPSGAGATANSAVPEPATFGLLVLGAFGIRLRRRHLALRVPRTR